MLVFKMDTTGLFKARGQKHELRIALSHHRGGHDHHHREKRSGSSSGGKGSGGLPPVDCSSHQGGSGHHSSSGGQPQVSLARRNSHHGGTVSCRRSAASHHTPLTQVHYQEPPRHSSTSSLRTTTKEPSHHRLGSSGGHRLLSATAGDGKVTTQELRASRSFAGVRDLTQLLLTAAAVRSRQQQQQQQQHQRGADTSSTSRLARRSPWSTTTTTSLTGHRQPDPGPHPGGGGGGSVVAPARRARRSSETHTVAGPHEVEATGLLTSLRRVPQRGPGGRTEDTAAVSCTGLTAAPAAGGQYHSSSSSSHGILPNRRKSESESNDVTTLPSSSSCSSSSTLYPKPCSNDESSHGLVTIRMKPDSQGKFGFNVKGGADQNLAILVSRVVPNTPADRCYPRLNEGDQVLFINGRDVSTMSHEQVVNFIRASRECHTGELVLTVKQNVYLGEDLEEPAFQYVPESLPASATVPAGSTAPLQESMLLLAEGLESGAVVAQFEQLYRRKPGLVLNEARKQENEKKNRYRDISPYDTTRVILTSAPPGDYINGSYVNMEIPGSGIINRYIACQGPLSTTCTDFWVMIWEQQSTLIVMLTTVVEQGRVKCHRYWPRLYESNTFGFLQVTCLKEEETPSFAFRQFTLINTESNEERHITHMQYLAWPDHGVPDDSTEFLDFITQVRQARAGMVEPTIVHCSAGIGRTGVLILMETAQCLIEANEPVYPLDSVRAMRDQRAMMIQTSSQYRFVCEAIQRVFQEGLVKPLSEYQQR